MRTSQRKFCELWWGVRWAWGSAWTPGNKQLPSTEREDPGVGRGWAVAPRSRTPETCVLTTGPFAPPHPRAFRGPARILSREKGYCDAGRRRRFKCLFPFLLLILCFLPESLSFFFFLLIFKFYHLSLRNEIKEGFLLFRANLSLTEKFSSLSSRRPCSGPCTRRARGVDEGTCNRVCRRSGEATEGKGRESPLRTEQNSRE